MTVNIHCDLSQHHTLNLLQCRTLDQKLVHCFPIIMDINSMFCAQAGAESPARLILYCAHSKGSRHTVWQRTLAYPSVLHSAACRPCKMPLLSGYHALGLLHQPALAVPSSMDTQ